MQVAKFLKRSVSRWAIMAPLILLTSWNAYSQATKAPPELIAALDAPKKVILYSLDPLETFRARPLTNGLIFQGYRELGQTTLDETRARAAIDSFRSSITAWKPSRDACVFEPRQALRVEGKDKTFDILLCYHCGDTVVKGEGAELPEINLSGSPTILNQLLADAKIPQSK